MVSTEAISMSLSGVFGYSRDAVRVKVKKNEGSLPSEYRKFSIDPQITSFEVLQSIIAKAFEIKGEFTVCYRAIDDYGQEAFLPLLSDWDLDAAFLSASEPCLSLQVDMKKCDESVNWESYGQTVYTCQKDVFGTIEIPRSQINEAKTQTRLPGLIMNRMEKTLNIFQRALNLVDDQFTGSIQAPKSPLADSDFRNFLDPIGQLNNSQELRNAIYLGGIEPSLRKVVWKFILNVYPEGMSGKQRMDYMKKKSFEYESLRETWRMLLQKGQTTDDLAYVTSMVRKDVLRTDRHHPFYAGSDDNQNIAALFNILTTYALNHPSVSYCQGMSDLASPLLVTMGDEAHAYICFCALMQRLKPNFMIDGITMTLKFQHLTEGLIYYDPEFYSYLKSHQAEDLLFCYRWLLLEMKREFAFDDALHMLEVLWSSIPPTTPDHELPLFENKFSLTPPPISPLLKTPRENPYTKVCALRRQSSSFSLSSASSSKCGKKLTHRQNQSMDESILAQQNRLRQQANMKPFSSLDDNSIQLFNLAPAPKSRSISPMNTHSDGDSLALVKKRHTFTKANRGEHLSSSTGNLMETSNKRYFPRRMLNDKSDSAVNELKEELTQNENEDLNKIPQGKVVKNLNEFLSFSSKTRILSSHKQRSQCNSISEHEIVDEIGSDVVQSNPTSPRKDDSSSPDESEYCPMTTSITRELKMDLENLDRQVLGPKKDNFRNVELNIIETDDKKGRTQQVELPKKNTDPEVFVWENPMPLTPDEQTELEFDYNNEVFVNESTPAPVERRRPIGSVSDDDSSEWSANASTTSNMESKITPNGIPVINAEEATEITSNFLTNVNATSLLNSLKPVNAVSNILKSPVRIRRNSLPPPHKFGDGNPFLMFLCLTLLRQHRDYIMRGGLDYNEMAMHFDKMVRKHNVATVLDQARQMFSSYLKQHSTQNESDKHLRV